MSEKYKLRTIVFTKQNNDKTNWVFNCKKIACLCPQKILIIIIQLSAREGFRRAIENVKIRLNT